MQTQRRKPDRPRVTPVSAFAFDDPALSAWLGDDETAAALTFDADLAAMLRFEAALAEAEAAHGVVPRAAATSIARACDGFRPDMELLRRDTQRDGMVVPSLVRQLRRAVGDEHGRHLHFGATSQDVLDSSLMLRLGPVLAIFAARIDGLSARLDQLDVLHGARPLMAYTRMRAALPITVGQRISGWRRGLRSDRDALETLRTTGLAVQFAGPVGDLAALGPRAGEVRATLAGLLGLADPGGSWHVDRRRLTALAHALADAATGLGKIGIDLGLMAQDGIGTVRLVGGSSSSMPHKVNPVDCELLVALARHAAILAGGVQASALHENERSGAAWTSEWLAFPQLLLTTGAALRAADRLFASVTDLGSGPASETDGQP